MVYPETECEKVLRNHQLSERTFHMTALDMLRRRYDLDGNEIVNGYVYVDDEKRDPRVANPKP